MSSRSIDIVLFGATGFTGGIVAEYLLTHAKPGLRLVLAGRNALKLAAVKEQLTARGLAGAENLPLEVVDATDEDGLSALLARATVVISTVGPYAQHGREIVRAAARSGTHYVDLSGEVQFQRWSIDSVDALARQTGACIVHACGFDSVPSDLGVLMLHEHLARHGGLVKAKLYVEAIKGGVSGGTAASLLNLLDEAADSPAVRELMQDPYALSPDRSRDRGPETSDDMSAHFDDTVKAYTAPFVMGQINSRVVRRSNVLAGLPYGKSFRYDERVRCGKGLKGGVLAHGMSLGMKAALALGSIGDARALMHKVLPAQGTGPSREAREAGGFRITVRGEAADRTHGCVVVTGTADPGYGETAKMLGEAALCFVEDLEALAAHPRLLASKGGVLTPATAFGTILVERLRAKGMGFEATSGNTG